MSMCSNYVKYRKFRATCEATAIEVLELKANLLLGANPSAFHFDYWAFLMKRKVLAGIVGDPQILAQNYRVKYWLKWDKTEKAKVVHFPG